VRVRGALGVGAVVRVPHVVGDLIDDVVEQPSCNYHVACCRHLRAPVLVGGAGGALAIEGLACSGDESRVCCNAPAYGQTVIATGRLVREEAGQTTGGWRLVNVTVCEVAARSGDRGAGK